MIHEFNLFRYYFLINKCEDEVDVEIEKLTLHYENLFNTETDTDELRVKWRDVATEVNEYELSIDRAKLDFQPDEKVIAEELRKLPNNKAIVPSGISNEML